MDMIVIKMQYQPDPVKIASKYSIEADDPLYPGIVSACHEICDLAKPVACFKESRVDEVGPDYVMIDGVQFHGKFIADRLRRVKTVYPYVASCGTELDRWGRDCGDLLLEYCYDDIRQSAIKPVLETVHKTIMNQYGAYKLSSLNPGSIPQWPITEQKSLFQLLGSVFEKVGVRLDKTMLMYPLKSVSGILFESEEGYCNCKICSRQNCPGRREDMDEDQMMTMLDF